MDPFGRRSKLPPTIRTALSAGTAGAGRRNALHLLIPSEEAMFVAAFQDLGWSVLICDDLFDIIEVETEAPVILLSDDPSVRNSLDMPWETPPAFVVLVDDHETAVEGAWSAGADWVITRPLNPSDVLGFSSRPLGPLT